MGGKRMIGEYSEDHLVRTAKDVVIKKTKDSVVLDPVAEQKIPKFDLDELTIGRVLGRGGFCVVNEISRIKLKKQAAPTDGSNHTSDQADESVIYNVVQDRAFMEKYCIRDKKDTRYAIKKLQESAWRDPQTFINGIVDLAIEARFLSVIRHPNIIKMRAVGSGSPVSTTYFVVLDRLYDTLSVRLNKWRQRKFTGIKRLLDRKGKKELAFWLERVTVAYDLTVALKHLHDMHIMYRDVKPDNIGFDVRGDVKIFDFGLAKEFDPDKSTDGLYNLTGDTGSPRYMAIEVALNKPYNEKVDVYSMAILCWQMFSMETPFEGYTVRMFNKKIVEGGHRPKCEATWPVEIQNMLRQGWCESKDRLSMEEFSNVLRDEINKNSDEEVCDIMDASRKSEMSLRRGQN
ncbi:hypothetical protein MPSEU_001018200 [Mayamaea pseudoterrestris]|nr:hypothetical protein MPSEU_001018200 [Mayamaea pseudoterrestris]